MVPPEELERVREEGRRQRRTFSKRENRRRALAGIVDTGSLSDNDIDVLFGALRAGQDEQQPTEIVPDARL